MTKKDGTFGLSGIGIDIKKLNPTLYGALEKLKNYEEICDSPDKLKEIDELYREKCEEVNRLRAKVEELKELKESEDRHL